MTGDDRPHPGVLNDVPRTTSRTVALDLQEILSRALLVATTGEARKLETLARRLRRRRLRVLVAGEAKRGKSTLVNALLDRPLLPTGVTPLTAVTTTVTTAAAGEGEHAVLTLLTGQSRPLALEDLAGVVTETGNPGNTLGADFVTVHVRSRLLERHPIDLVDTPGTGSVYAHNTAEAGRALASLDAAVLVLSVDPPVTKAERDLLREVDRLSVRTFVLLNKSDRLTPEEVSEAEAFTREVCAAATGRPVSVRACSARAGQNDPGFTTFTAELGDYLDQRAELDIDAAANAHLTRTLTGMLDTRLVRIRTLELAADGQQRRVEELAARLTTIAGRRTDIGDRCAGSLSRLRQDLDRSAAAAVTPIARACRQSLDRLWDNQLASLDPAAAEDQARDAGTAFIAAAVDRWRTDQVRTLEAGLAAVIGQAEQDVTVQAQLARDAIQDLLDLTVDAAADLPRLVVDPSFRYDFTRAQGWAPPLHGLTSRLGSASRRRRRARQRVMGEVAALSDRQVGRSRSDLQRRLEETGRAIRHALEDHLADAVDVFTEMLTQAGPDLSQDGRADRAPDEPQALHEQTAQLRQLLGGLGEPRPEPHGR